MKRTNANRVLAKLLRLSDFPDSREHLRTVTDEEVVPGKASQMAGKALILLTILEDMASKYRQMYRDIRSTHVRNFTDANLWPPGG